MVRVFTYWIAAVSKMTKIKSVPEESEAQAEGCSEERTYEELLVNLNPIAQPLASRRLTRKLYKCIKKGEAAGRVANAGRSGRRAGGHGLDEVAAHPSLCSREAEADSAWGEGGSEICQQRRERVRTNPHIGF